MDVTQQQGQAVKAILDWHKNFDADQKPYFYLGGYAGTGKTTLAKEIAANIKGGTILFAAFTGKAAVVLQSKGCWNASTIHSLIYKPIEDKDGIVTYSLNNESLVMDAALIIIDECSMVGDELGADLLSFGVPVLVLGDPAQLPPVKSEGYFTNGAPDFMLTEIHRQAKENPIIAMSMLVRNGKELPRGNYGESRVISQYNFDSKDVINAEQVLCGMNKTRLMANDRIRELKGYSPTEPVVGDRLVCLKNNRKMGLLNGSLWDISQIKKRYKETTQMVVKPIDAGMSVNPVPIYIHDHYFRGTENALDWKVAKQYNPFTYGYVLTTHKAQGSQWKDVLLFDESSAFRDDRYRWLYTAITRASEKITIVV